MRIFEKSLSASEKDRHWILVPSQKMKYFPKPDVSFTLRIGRQEVSTYIDRYKRLRLVSRNFDKLDLDSLEGTIVMSQTRSGRYFLTRED